MDIFRGIMTEHTCQPSNSYHYWPLALEPKEVNSEGQSKPRCYICGKYMSRPRLLETLVIVED
jgi:hypothetical protein